MNKKIFVQSALALAVLGAGIVSVRDAIASDLGANCTSVDTTCHNYGDFYGSNTAVFFNWGVKNTFSGGSFWVEGSSNTLWVGQNALGQNAIIAGADANAYTANGQTYLGSTGFVNDGPTSADSSSNSVNPGGGAMVAEGCWCLN